MMNKKEREQYKYDKIRYFYIYRSLSYGAIADELNADIEFVKRCGKTNASTVGYWVTQKIKPELDSFLEGDALDSFNAEFMRSMEFKDGEISDIGIILKRTDLDDSDRIKYMTLRHQIETAKMTLLADKAVPLSVRKWRKDRNKYTSKPGIVTVDKPPELAEVLKDRVRPKDENEE